MSGAQIGRHIASLNLFEEADGKLHVTVAGGDVTSIERLYAKVFGDDAEDITPHDMTIKLLNKAEEIE